MNENRIQEILENYRLGKATEEELAFLESWYLSYYAASPDEMSVPERLAATSYVWSQLAQQSQPPVKLMYNWRRMAAAAILVLSLSTAGYFTWKSLAPDALNTSQLAQSGRDIAPGASKATLTDATGKVLELDTAQTGIQVAGPQLSYNNGVTVNGMALEKNKARQLTLQTPNGGSYQVTLPDGSKVWLNAATTLSFPSSFEDASERLVQLTGEAYFEIAPNARAPFRVKASRQTVEVLGTHFNINSYADEPSARTTLLEGSIRIGNTILKPGEQATQQATGMKITEVNTDAVIGWKNNYIVFEDEKIEAVMRKISRWYNVEIEYEGEHPADDFAGRVNRYAYVSQVLKKLELTNKVHFTIKGRKIIVTK